MATTPRILGHRGAPRAARENTLEAFAAALAEGADGVELDVHATADGVLVCHHDCEVPEVGLIESLDWAALRAAAPSVPTLDAVLDLCAGTLVNIEVKNSDGDPGYDPTETAAAAVVALLAVRGGRDEVVVSSFSLASIDRVRALDPNVPTGLLYAPDLANTDALFAARVGGHGSLHPHWVSLAGDEGAAFVAECHAAGITVNVWTVNDEPVATSLAAAGVDALITDTPAILRTWL
ncbi:MAG: glycerophosphodiester phosphodiesterase [Actinomycetes bacterium]